MKRPFKVGDKVFYDGEETDWWETHKRLSGVGYVVVDDLEFNGTGIIFSYYLERENSIEFFHGAHMPASECELYSDFNSIEPQTFN